MMKNHSTINGIYTLAPIEKDTSVLILDSASDRFSWVGKASKDWLPSCKENLYVLVTFEDGTTDIYSRRLVRPVTITH